VKYEFKYIVPVNKMDSLREAIHRYVELDPYTADAQGHEYTVRSIYFDTSRFDYYWEKVDGYKIRKKIRIRGYNHPHGDESVFLEIKRKLKEPIEKDRQKLTFKNMVKLMEGRGIDIATGIEDEQGINDAGKFLYHVYRNNLKPVVLVIYEREAYFDRFLQQVRITIDKNLRCVAYPEIRDLYREERAITALKDRFILEVKFREHFPGWLRPITGQLGLVKQSASKYIFAVNAHHLADATWKPVASRLVQAKGI
jgi:SPX domain protein involved in polyphosphate accumulation